MRNIPEYVSKAINDVVESDFNPDIIMWAMDDCYTQGLINGRVEGAVIEMIATLTTALCLAKLIIYIKKKEES